MAVSDRSSLTMVPVALAVPSSAAPDRLDRVRLKVSSASVTLSSMRAMETVALVWPAARVTRPLLAT